MVIRPALTKGAGKGTGCLKEEGAGEEKLRSETTQGNMLAMGGGEELGMRLKRLRLLGHAGDRSVCQCAGLRPLARAALSLDPG